MASARSAAVGATRLAMLPHHVHRREPSRIAHVELRAEVHEDDTRGRQACTWKTTAVETAAALKQQWRGVSVVREPAGTGCRRGAVWVATGGPQCHR